MTLTFCLLNFVLDIYTFNVILWVIILLTVRNIYKIMSVKCYTEYINYTIRNN